MIEYTNIYDLTIEVVGALLLWDVLDWVDAIVKVGVVDIVVTWFSFFIGMMIKNKISNTDISYMKYWDLNLFGYAIVRIGGFAGKVLALVFKYLIDARCNRSILFNILLLDKPARFNELVTDRAKRYKRLAEDHLIEKGPSHIESIIYKFRSELSLREKLQYDFGCWLCKQMQRVDKEHCSE